MRYDGSIRIHVKGSSQRTLLPEAVIEDLTFRQQEAGRLLLEREFSEDEGIDESFFSTMAERPQFFLSLLRSTAREQLVEKLMHDHMSFFLAQWEKDGITTGPGGIDLQLCATFVAGGDWAT